MTQHSELEIYMLDCPVCKKKLQLHLKYPLKESRIKCRYCDAIFNGRPLPEKEYQAKKKESPAFAISADTTEKNTSTRQRIAAMSAQRPSGPPEQDPITKQPAIARRPSSSSTSKTTSHSRRRYQPIRPKPVWPWFVLPLLILAIVGVCFLIYWKANDKKDSNAQTGQTAEHISQMEPSAPQKTEPSTEDTTPDTVDMKTTQVSGGTQISGQASTDWESAKDRNANTTGIAVTHFNTVSNDPLSGVIFAGGLRNDGKNVIKEAVVSVDVKTGDSFWKANSSPIQWLAPGQTLPFSIQSDHTYDEQKDVLGKPRIHAVTADSSWVVLPLAGVFQLRESDLEKGQPQKILINENLTNSTSKRLKNLQIWCDFFTDEGQYVTTAKGKLDEERKTLPSEKTVRYSVNLEAKNSPMPLELIKTAAVRLVAQVAEGQSP